MLLKIKAPYRVLRYSAILIFLLLFCQYAWGQKFISRENALRDILFTENALKSYHPQVNKYQDKTLENARNKAISQLKDKQLDRQLDWILAGITSSIGDLHTSAASRNKRDSKIKYLPFYLTHQYQKWMMRYNFLPDSCIDRSVEIMKINDITTDSLAHTFSQYFSADAHNAEVQDYWLSRRFTYLFTRYYGNMDSVKVEYRQNETLHTTYWPMITASNISMLFRKRYSKQLTKNFKFQIIDSLERKAYWSIQAFSSPQKKHLLVFPTFSKSVKDIFKTIEKEKIEKLILDFRANSGGKIKYARQLTAYFVDQPRQLVDSILFKKSTFKKHTPVYLKPLYRLAMKPLNPTHYIFHRKYAFKPKKKYHYNGEVQVLIDPGSYSATVMTINILRKSDKIKLVGTQTGGVQWGSFAGKWKNIKTPAIKTRLHIPTFSIYNFIPESQGFIQADHPVSTPYEDFYQFTDTTLEWAKKN